MVPLFDARGKRIEDIVFSGSKIKVSFSVRPYLVESSKSIGVSLDLNAVQVIELAEGGAAEAGDYGFAEEDGYEAESGVSDDGDETDF